MRHRNVALLQAAWVEYRRDRARHLAVAMIYYALVSLVPLLLLLASALGLLLRFWPAAAEAERRMLHYVQAGFGRDLSAVIERLLDTLQAESIAAAVLSLAGILLTASALFRYMRLGFCTIWGHDQPLAAWRWRTVVRATVLDRVIGFAVLLGGGCLLVAALLLIAATEWLNGRLGALTVVGEVVGWLLTASTSFILAAMAFAAVFKYMPPVALRWRDVWFATLLCATGWVAAGEFMTVYGAVLGDVSTYTAIGGLLPAMLWINAVSQMLFFGADLCKVVAAGNGTAPGVARG